MGTTKETIWIDGAAGEGGGQIIRTSVALSALTGRPLEIANIRARRSKPGLQAQHLTAVKAAAALCDAELHGASVGSQFLRFVPNARVTKSEFTFDVGTAGATGLVAQTLLVPLGFLPNLPANVSIVGGTHVPMAPVADYIETVYVPMLRRMGAKVDFAIEKAGFFPKGGGRVRFTVESAMQEPLDLTERGRLLRLHAVVVTCQLPEHVAKRGFEALQKDLKGYGVPVETEHRDLPGVAPGAAVFLRAECENGSGGWTAVGERGKPIERVAMEALREFQKWFATGAATDEHLADQLVLPCAFVPSESRWTTPVVTEHLKTVLHVVQQFLPVQYTLTEQADGTTLVCLTGVSFA